MFDPATLAAYAAAATATARAEAVRDSLGSGTLAVELRDGETLVYSGTFAGPMTASGGSLSADVLLSGLVTTVGTPSAATWTCRIRNASGRYIEGSLGPGGRFTWSGGSLVVGQAVRLGISIGPAPGSLPAWLQGAPLLTWVEIPNTRMVDVMPVVTGKESGITAYSGGALVGTDLFVNGGGHTDYNGNEWLRLRLGLDVPVWDIPVPASAAADRTQNQPYYLDGKPCSRHTYDAIAWVPQHGRLFLLGGVPPFSSGSPPASLHVDGVDVATFQWDLPNAGAIWPDMPHYSSGMPVAQSPDHLWIWSNANLYRCDKATMQWTNCGGVTGSTRPDRGALHDPQRNRLFRTGQLFGTGGPQYMSLDGYSGGMPTATNVEFNTAAAPGFSPDCSVIYCPDLGGSDCYLAHVRGDDDMTVFRIDPDTFVVTVVPMDGAKPPIPAIGYGAGEGIYGRFAYVPQLKGCVWAHHSTRNTFFFRTG